MLKPLKEQLVDILIENKIITVEQLDQALKVQKKSGGRLSNILVSLKLANEKEIPLLATKLFMYECCGRLYKKGLPNINDSE